MNQKVFYVQVIEAREVISRIPTATVCPGVTVKYSGSTTKRSTGFKTGKTYWAEVFTFPVDNVHSDTVTFQLREKGYHVVSSDWIGETCLKLSDYDDGNVHLKWFRMGNAKGKQHSKAAKGVLLLKLHLTTKSEKPFYKKPMERQLSYDEWIDWSESQYANAHKGGIAETAYPKDPQGGRARGDSVINDFPPSSRSRSSSIANDDMFSRRNLARSEETNPGKVDSDGETSDRSSGDNSPSSVPARSEENSAASIGSAKPLNARFPISPIADTPEPIKRFDANLLIDLSTPEVNRTAPAPAAKRNNPFSADVMALQSTFADINLNQPQAPQYAIQGQTQYLGQAPPQYALQGQTQYLAQAPQYPMQGQTLYSGHPQINAVANTSRTGNPFLDATPEVPRTSQPNPFEAY